MMWVLYKFRLVSLQKCAGCKVETVYDYEKSGWCLSCCKLKGGHRVYVLLHIKRLNFIRCSRQLGFDIEQLRLIDEPNYYCDEVQEMVTV
ncbi:MerR family transcriptional regulator [Vibrio fluvialis]